MARESMSSFVIFFILFSIFPTIIHSVPTHENSTSSQIIPNCIDVERQILISFKESLEDPTGMLSSWSGTDCCKWSGVGCSKRNGHITKLDLRGSWDELAFSVLGLKGKLNPSLFELKYLHYLDLSCNDFESSTIPSSIGSLKRLRYLNLSLINFAGMVPPHIGNLSNLLYLDLHASYDNGGIISYLISPSIPATDLSWLSGLSLLKYLNLGSVNLSLASNRWLQAVGTLSSIEELHFSGCKLHDLPHQSPSVLNFTSLSVLNLARNYFNATLPSWLLNVTTLTRLNLRDAGIKDSFDNVKWKHLCNLKSLDLSDNGMSGEIVRFIDSLSKCSNVSIEELRLWANNLQGQLPESLGLLRNLRYLDLSINMISGFIPASMANLSHLTVLSMGNNQLQGTLPQTIGQLEGLAELYLEGNNWVGVISEIHFIHLKSLKHFSLSSKNRSLAFDVSPNWVPSFSLMSIEMTNCEMDPKYFPFWLKTQTQLSRISFDYIGIIGEIPSWFWELISPRLTYLSLSNNQLSGKLPMSLMFAPDASMVDLSYNLFEGSLPIFLQVENLNVRNNSFSGQIPATIGSQMPRLSQLVLSENSLTGDIPSSIGRLTTLITLFLSDNNLTGKIPQLEGLQTLSTLDLSNNHLVGEIPQLLCSLPRLQQLILNNNNLSGNIATLRNCTSLYELRLADNHFIGNIPRWIGEKMQHLSILSVRGNSFTGIIPETLCQLPYLHILDLGQNNLSGVIPSCVGNLEGLRFIGDPAFARYAQREERMELNMKGRILTYTWAVVLVNSIDLSRNHLEGEIPEGLTTLTRLGTLNLSQNQLTGTLPEKIGHLTLLETLDFSSNNLTGQIPTSITNLTSLSHLNLSYNNLSGQIPTANQFLTLNDDPSIYEGNLYLCGSPLPRKCSTSSTDYKKGPDQGSDENEKEEKVLDMLWFDIGLTSGVIVGFWIVCGSLAINKTWRHQVCLFLDKATDRVYVAIAVKLARWSREIKC